MLLEERATERCFLLLIVQCFNVSVEGVMTGSSYTLKEREVIKITFSLFSCSMDEP
jgi:hypothetical protein